MPELPEVQTVVSQLSNAIQGATIDGVQLNRADYVRTSTPDLVKRLIGQRITTVGREGKRILLDLQAADNFNKTGRKTTRAKEAIQSNAKLVLHLGMSGRITLEPPSAPLMPHTHLQIQFTGQKKELRFRDPRRFGGIWYFQGDEPAVGKRLSPLGPDALEIKTETVREICRHKRQLKALLLDQYVISGLGNIYCDEALFSARLHPLMSANDLSEAQVQTLATSIRATLRKAVSLGGSTLRDYRQADGTSGFFQIIHRVYGREGQPCPRCRRKIERIQVAGRSTHICTTCQPI